MPRVHLSGSICQRAGGCRFVEADGDTAAAVIRSLEDLHPGLRGWVVDERGALRRHVKLFRRGDPISLETQVAPDDELHVVAAISGG